MSTIALAEVSILPRPKSVKEKAGSFTLTRETPIVYETGSDAAKGAADYLASVLRPATGYACPVKAGSRAPNAIFLRTAGATDDPGRGDYALDAGAEGVVITAATGAGLFYGIQTLRQLLPADIMKREVVNGRTWTVPGVTIEDGPRFVWRGMLLDVTRHFFPPKDVKRIVDLLAFYKLNVLHLHLTDDQGWRIEIKKYPRLTEIGSIRAESPKRGNRKQGDGTPYGPFFYTQDEIRDIVAYAAERHITVVPEIELPGHSRAALAAYPELGCTGGPYKVRTRWGIEPDIYCAGNDKAFTFLEDVLTEVLELFPSKFIHIGGDEAPKQRWNKCPKCQARIQAEGLHNSHELQSYFIRRIEKFLNAKGRRLIGWDEILEGGLAPNASVMSWRGVKGGIAAAKSGHDVVMSPTSYCYLDYYQSTNKAKEPEAIGGYVPLKRVYSYEPVPDSKQLDPAMARHILGVQGNVWTEYIRDRAQVEYMAFPRIIAISEIGWSPKQGKDYDDFHARLEADLGHLDAAGVNYRKLDPEPILIGGWKANEPTEEWAVRTWDITKSLTEAGEYDVTFQYTGGACRLDVRWAEVLLNGQSVARDQHLAMTGARDHENVYRLGVKELPPGAKVTLRAEIRGDGGTDSNGEIYLVKAR